MEGLPPNFTGPGLPNPIPPIPPETEAEYRFWIHQNRWANWNVVPTAPLALGIEHLLAGQFLLGGSLTVGALLGFIYVDRQLKVVPGRGAVAVAPRQSITGAMAILAILAWAPVAYDVIKIQYRGPEVQPPVIGAADMAAHKNELKIEADITPPYEIFATPSWGTAYWIEKREKGSFTLGFANPSPEGATLDWQVIPIPASKAKSKELADQFAAQDEQLQTLRSEVSTLRAREWPVLADEKKAALISALKSMGPHSLMIACNDDDCLALADSISDAATTAGWNPTTTSGALAAMQPGVTLYGQPDHARDQLAKTLQNAIGVQVKLDIVDRDYLFAIGRKPHP